MLTRAVVTTVVIWSTVAILGSQARPTTATVASPPSPNKAQLSLLQRRQDNNAMTALSNTKVELIKQTLIDTANKSWEMGTHAEALLEFDYPALSVFYSTYHPIPATPVALPVLQVAASAMAQRPSSTASQIIPDGSAADPASLGVAVLLGNASAPDGGVEGISKAEFGAAAERQLRALLEDTPRTEDGAISHRVEQVSLWSDFVYMVPPFLAYYGVISNNASLVQEAYDQCRLYRQYLRTPETGLWRHIVFGENPDPGLWATGNGWAAAGMIRVVASIVNSDFNDQFRQQREDLVDWINEIVEAAFRLQSNTSLMHNYLNETSTFYEAASSALLTSVVYRLAQLEISSPVSPSDVDATRLSIYSRVNGQTGILAPVVNPLSFEEQGEESPEGQAFVLLMEAAWRDWREMSDKPGQGGTVTDQTSGGASLGGRVPSSVVGAGSILVALMMATVVV